jgi:hypothetical protein
LSVPLARAPAAPLQVLQTSPVMALAIIYKYVPARRANWLGYEEPTATFSSGMVYDVVITGSVDPYVVPVPIPPAGGLPPPPPPGPWITVLGE